MRKYKRRLERFFEDKNFDVKIVNAKRGAIVDYYDLKLGGKANFSTIKNRDVDIGLILEAPITPIIKPVGHLGVVRIEAARAERKIIPFNARLVTLPLDVHLGKGSNNQSIVLNLSSCPHLLVAGSTQSGKSVILHNIIRSALKLYRKTNLYLIDPKKVEFSFYKDTVPVVYSINEAVELLNDQIDEMNIRLSIFDKAGMRNIIEYNEVSNNQMKYNLIVIDELADLILNKEFEEKLAELAQKSRAAGIHLVVATQRPSADIVNGVIKANFPARIACRVPTHVDSKVILDAVGAENLIGKGDALLIGGQYPRLTRFQAAYQTVKDIKNYIESLPLRAIQLSINNVDAKSEPEPVVVSMYLRFAQGMYDAFKIVYDYKDGTAVDISMFHGWKNWRQSYTQPNTYQQLLQKMIDNNLITQAEEINTSLPFIKHKYYLNGDTING